GKITRRAAKPRADIEHALASSKADEFGEPHRRRPLPAVKLVDRRQIVRRQTVEVLPGRLQRRNDRLAEILARVMSFDCVVPHALALSPFDRMASPGGAGRAAGWSRAIAPCPQPRSLRAGSPDRADRRAPD